MPFQKLLVVFSFSLFVGQVAQAQVYSSKTMVLEIQGDEVVVDGTVYKFGEEVVIDAYAVGSVDFLSKKKNTRCRILTTIAKELSDGAVILLEVARSKPSESGGVFCFMAKPQQNFSNPHYFKRTVVKFDANRATVESVVVSDQIGRPDKTVQEILNPGFFDDPEVAAFLESGRVEFETHELGLQN